MSTLKDLFLNYAYSIGTSVILNSSETQRLRILTKDESIKRLHEFAVPVLLEESPQATIIALMLPDFATLSIKDYLVWNIRTDADILLDKI